jgi:hypothetical protein
MARQHQENPAAKMWLLIGVSAITVIILVLWGWAASIPLSSFSWDKTPEKKLVEKSQNNWDALFNNKESQIKNEQMKLQIKNILNTITAEVNTMTGVTSTTNTNTTTSSTVSTTN